MERNLVAALLQGLTSGIKEGVEKRQESKLQREKLAAEVELKNKELALRERELSIKETKTDRMSLADMYAAERLGLQAEEVGIKRQSQKSSEIDKINDNIMGTTKSRGDIMKEYDVYLKKFNNPDSTPEDLQKIAPIMDQYEKTLSQLDDQYDQQSRLLYEKSGGKLGNAPIVVPARSADTPLPQNEVQFNFDRAPKQVKEAWNRGISISNQPDASVDEVRALVASQQASFKDPKEFTAFASAMGARFNEGQKRLSAAAADKQEAARQQAQRAALNQQSAVRRQERGR